MSVFTIFQISFSMLRYTWNFGLCREEIWRISLHVQNTTSEIPSASHFDNEENRTISNAYVYV